MKSTTIIYKVLLFMLKINKNLVGQCDNLIIYLSDPNKQQKKNVEHLEKPHSLVM